MRIGSESRIHGMYLSMAGRVAKKVITQAYVDRFNQELKMLGASRIKVELIKTQTKKGQALHALRLKGVKPTTENAPETVLSEGERRVVSLAAFLADVAEKPHAAPFIFDDPFLRWIKTSSGRWRLVLRNWRRAVRSWCSHTGFLFMVRWRMQQRRLAKNGRGNT